MAGPEVGSSFSICMFKKENIQYRFPKFQQKMKKRQEIFSFIIYENENIWDGT
jgi:hypothetical protein